MKTIGSVLAILGGILVIAATLASLMSVNGMEKILEFDVSSEERAFVIVAAILAIMITVLAFLSFSSKPKFLGLVIIAASFAGIIVGGTFTDIAMLLSACGGITLYTLPKPKAEPEKADPKKTEPEDSKPSNPS